MVINNVNLPDINVADALAMERYEHAHDNVAKAMNDLQPEGKRQSELIRAQCTAVFNFFDEIFGDGTAKKVFGESVNLTICLNAYADVIKAVNALGSKLGNMYKGRANAMNRNNHKGKNRKQYNHHKKALKLIER